MMSMQLPPPFYDLLSWIVITDIILLFTLEVLSPYYGRTNIVVDRIRLGRIVRITTVLVIIITFWLLWLHL